MERINRREFIASAVAGTLAMNSALRPSWGAGEARPKLKLGLIGCGWYGMVDVRAAFKAGDVEVIALCDVDEKQLTDSAAAVEKLQGSRPKTFKHYEDLLNVPGMEGIILATPPHWHALPFIAAMERNLHVYCEKPLAYDIREARAMVNAAAGKKAVVQVGFQRRQSPSIRQAREYIQQGKLGKIIQVDAQIHYKADIRDTKVQDPPASLDWDLWCGPAPKLPYCSADRPLCVAPGEDHGPRAPRGLGHPSHRCGPVDPGRDHPSFRPGLWWHLLLQRQDHHAGPPERAVRLCPVPRGLETPHVGCTGILP